MKIETALSRPSPLGSRAPSGRAWRAIRPALLATALGALAVTKLAACKSSSASGGSGSATNVDACAANVGNTSGNAVRVTSGASYQSKICFGGTPNWFVITVPAGNTLLDVAAGYPPSVSTDVDLELKLFFKTNGTTLTQLDDLVAPTQSDAGGTGTLQTTLFAAQPGDYYIEVADAHESAFDATDAYGFMVTSAVDPDSHEPNDTTADAKPSDAKPGWLSYMGDLDVFSTTVASATDLLTLTLNNPATAPADIQYQVTSSTGTIVSSGVAPAVATPLTTVVPVTAAGTYYVTLSYPTGATPDRAASDGYLLTFGSTSDPDTAATNHTIATATCPGGGSGAGNTGPCAMAYSGSAVTLPAQMGYMAVPGQKDFYRVDVSSGAPLVLQIKLTSAATTTVGYSVDLLAVDPGSACSQDSDCTVLDAPCSAATDCELSHACLASAQYTFCPSGQSCSLCAGAGICVPASASGASGGNCALNQYLSDVSAGGTTAGSSTVSTAQPLFNAGSYYLVVHDAQYKNFDETNPYTLSLQLAPEPDPNDQSPVAANRNNFYEPYPSASTNLSPSAARAIDITAQVMQAADGGTPAPITGYISYQTDEDWFKFQHPCPGSNCGIDFSWLQPGPSNAHIAFFMLNQDLSVHESFAYAGTVPTASLTTPQTGTFANTNGDCTQCSFAGSTVTTADAGAPYYYYMRITDVGQANWDFSGTGQYNFSVTGVTPGCPGACSYASAGECTCWCTATMSCPAPTF